MSYEITFKNVPENILETYKVNDIFNTDKSVVELKYRILEDCIKYESKFDNHINAFLDDIQYCIGKIAFIQGKLAKKDFYDGYNNDEKYSPKNSYTLCGSNYRQSILDYDIETKSLLKHCLDKFVMFGAFIGMPDYDKNPDSWLDRYDELKDIIDYLIDETYQNMILHIKDELYQYSDEYAKENDLSFDGDTEEEIEIKN